MRDLDKICDDFLREARNDYVGLWQVINAVERDLKPTSVEERQRLTLEVIKRLIARGLQAVDLEASGSGCRPWSDQNVESVVRRINAEWKTLGREPSIGDIVWFNNPEAGGRTDRK